MGSAQSTIPRPNSSSSDEDDEEEDEEQEQEEDNNSSRRRRQLKISPSAAAKVLEQEPEILPCRASASPLSPQPSVAGTPRIKVWDPCHVLAPPPGPPPSSSTDADAVEVLLITHGECGAALRPDLVGGRWPATGLTGNGERQARALAVMLNSIGVRFSAVYCSPLDRARATAALVCRELDFSEDQIQTSDALTEMSQGQWEGCHRSEIYTPEILNLIERTQPDFSAPAGESLRQVEFRMIEFLNRIVLRLPEKMATIEALLPPSEAKAFSRQSSTNSVQDRDAPHWDLVYRLNRPGLSRKKSGKSRLQFVTTGDNETEDEFSPREVNSGQLHETHARKSTTCIGIFTHSIPIKCVLASILDCSPIISDRICIDDSSITVLHHSLRTGWQIKRLNDTAHLRLL